MRGIATSRNETIALHDLTNTFFKCEAKTNLLAKKIGRSKEKRSDCPLVTLGLVLDGSGFPRKSQVFPGNASEQNIEYLIEHHYTYMVVSRKRKRTFDEDWATLIKDFPG